MVHVCLLLHYSFEVSARSIVVLEEVGGVVVDAGVWVYEHLCEVEDGRRDGDLRVPDNT